MKFRCRKFGNPKPASRFAEHGLPDCRDLRKYKRVWMRLYRQAQRRDRPVRRIRLCDDYATQKRYGFIGSACRDFVREHHPEVFAQFRRQAQLYFSLRQGD